MNFWLYTWTYYIESAIGAFMTHFRSTYPGESIPIKMHLLEDHTVSWIRANHFIGFGLMGEQGAESIHAKFNRLYSTYCTTSSTTHQLEKLKYIMKEHLLNISPTLVSSRPPPCKRSKTVWTWSIMQAILSLMISKTQNNLWFKRFLSSPLLSKQVARTCKLIIV